MGTRLTNNLTEDDHKQRKKQRERDPYGFTYSFDANDYALANQGFFHEKEKFFFNDGTKNKQTNKKLG